MACGECEMAPEFDAWALASVLLSPFRFDELPDDALDKDFRKFLNTDGMLGVGAALACVLCWSERMA